MMKVPKLSVLIEDERHRLSMLHGLCLKCGFTLQQHFYQTLANGGISYLCPDDEETIAFLDQLTLKVKK